MTIAFSIPFWAILIFLIIIGIVGFKIIIGKSRDYDFFTPMFAIGFALFFIVLAIGLALGKWVF